MNDPSEPTEPYNTPTQDMHAKNRRASKAMIGVIVVMFIFGFASIPIYNLLCNTIDPGGNVYAADAARAKSYDNVKVDNTRKVSVRLATTVNSRLPWTFKTSQPRTSIHPGERLKVDFIATNLTDEKTRGRAIYDINPPEAGKYFKKIECFCFKEQPLGANETVKMPLVFWFESDLPAHIKEVTIGYTFFNMETNLEKVAKN